MSNPNPNTHARPSSAPDQMPHPDSAAPATAAWPRLLSMALLTGAGRHAGSVLAGFAMAWWHHD